MAINVKIKQKQSEDNIENEVEDIYIEQWSSIILDFKKKKNTSLCLFVLIIFLKDTNNAGLALTLGLKL